MQDYWYPWTPARYRADTLHLTPLEDGVYRRLIDHYMETKLPLPDNDLALARIAGLPLAEFKQIEATIRVFFKQEGGALVHKKCDAVLRDQAERADKYRNRSSAGGKAKAEKYNNNINASSATGKQQALLNSATDITDNTDRIDNNTPVSPQGDGGRKKLNGAVYIGIRDRAKKGEYLTQTEKEFMWAYEEQQLEAVKG